MDYNKLKDIIKGSVNEAFMENGLVNVMPLNEMAVRRSDYIQYCMSQSPTVYKHIGKICVYENDERMSHYVKHWEKEYAEVRCNFYDDINGYKRRFHTPSSLV